jgi:TrmH family RNA methyltransferase
MATPSLTRAEERLLFGLRRRAFRAERGLFLAEGVRVAEELAASGLSIELAAVAPSLEDTPRGLALVQELSARGPVRRIAESEVRRLAATDAPQGVILAAAIPPAGLEQLSPPARALLLVLDGVQDPGNFGTLVRSADAFGAAAVIAMTGTVDPWNPKAVRAAAGSSFHVPIAIAETRHALDWLRNQKFSVLAADTEGQPIDNVSRAERTALVVGNEGAGVSEAVRSAADAIVAVPIRGKAESLNVAVAAGILLYLLNREIAGPRT